MFQIVFNEISAAEMAALPTALQLDLLADFEVLPEEGETTDPEQFGVIERDGKKLLRYRVRDYRIYFERAPEGITVHRVLHRNTIRSKINIRVSSFICCLCVSIPKVSVKNFLR